VQGADVFQAILYSGTGSTQSITGAGFQPDLIWGKDLTAGSHFQLYDSSRGTTKVVYSSSNAAEGTVSGVTAFNSDGFSLGSDAGMNASGTNNQVAWCWKDNGGTTASNGSGSTSTTVQVASEGHMSIATLTAPGGATTFGHGLSGAPDFVTIKKRDTGDSWYTWMAGMNGDQYLTLETTDEVKTNSNVYASTPTATVVSFGSIIGSGTYVMYCFRNVPGVCQTGTYTGTGSVDGPMVNVGMQCRWVVIKSSAAGGGWARALTPFAILRSRLVIGFN